VYGHSRALQWYKFCTHVHVYRNSSEVQWVQRYRSSTELQDLSSVVVQYYKGSGDVPVYSATGVAQAVLQE